MIDSLFVGLSKTIETGDFKYLMVSFIRVLRNKGVNVDRLQIPMNKISGLRHPKYGVILLTYADDELDTMYIPHESLQHSNNTGFDHLRNTPFAPVLEKPNTVVQQSLRLEEVEFDRLRELKTEGYTDYAAINMVLPHGPSQLCSVATRNSNGLGANAESLIEELLPSFSVCLYGAYQSNVATSLAGTYLGNRTGENVLSGSMYRGSR